MRFFSISSKKIICRHCAAQIHLLVCSSVEDDSQPAREGGKWQEPRERGQQCPAALMKKTNALNKRDLGAEGRFPSLKFAIFGAEEQSIHPSSLQKKCREAICSAPRLLSGLCRTQFSTLSRKLRPESASVFEAGVSKLHPQIADMLHPVCTSRS